MTHLPYDVARCIGTSNPVCTNCRRREPGHPTRQLFVTPPPDVNDTCPLKVLDERK